MRILGLDFGSRTVGVAMSDETEFLASPVETIFRKDEANLKSTVQRIRQICARYEVGQIVVGLPLNMDGTAGVSAEKAKAFAHRLEKEIGRIPVSMQDERLSTFDAEQPMIEAGLHDWRKRKKKVDQLAACVFLQDYLDQKTDHERGKT